MSFHVRNPKTDAKVRELARKRGISLTEAIDTAVDAELRRVELEPTMLDKIHALQAEIAKRPRSGLKADKAFFDDLSGQGDD